MSPRSEGVLAIDFGGTKVAVTAGSPAGVLSEEFGPHAPPRRVLGLAADLATRLGGRPEVVSIATPGVIVDGHARFAPNVAGWDEVDLARWGRDTFGAAVVLTNDVEAAAAGEALAGALRGVDVGLYLNLGTGLAAAIVLDGVVVKGAHGVGGEIGYAKTGAARDVDWSHDRAQLERLAGGIGLREAGIRIPDDAGPDWLDDPAGARVKEALDEVARHLTTCVLLVDPQVVVLGGGLARLGVVSGHLRRRVRQAALADVDVTVSAFARHASVLGALEIGIAARSKP